ncbi:hypothetical protein [Singulisphaera acidiphila]|uniref:hypothetical protein n=1 Tax=Singulisphaera acidiphila TaxID=466153 RepID=UPI00036E71A6|nr:hypothetical protein [Singulisphaera acidiphila]
MDGRFKQISHATLVNGAAVMSAGEGRIQGIVADISPYTGHYKIDLKAFEIAKEAFRRAGFIVK